MITAKEDSLLTEHQLDITHLDEVLELLKTSHFMERNWLTLGLKLGLLKTTLDSIEVEHRGNLSRCLMECLCLWLQRVDKVDERGGPIWETLAAGLGKIGENESADKTREKVKNEAVQRYYTALQHCLIDPVKVAQLLFSGRCISERTLDEIETLERTLDEKKTSLLTAIHSAVSSNHKTLKLLATLLSKFEEMKVLSERVLAEYDKKFTADHISVATAYQVTTGHNDQMSLEDHASDILRCHYGSLSQSLRCPIQIGQFLYGEKIISETEVVSMETCNQSVMVLLKAVRYAVHTNYQNLKVFGIVLQRFTGNIELGDSIIKEYDKMLDNIDSAKPKHPIAPENSPSDEGNVSSQDGIFVPRNMIPTFHTMRLKFGTTFNKIRNAVKQASINVEDLRVFLQDCYPDLTHLLGGSTTDSIDGVLDIVKGKCTLIDVCVLKAIADRFNVTEAGTYIRAYENAIDEFCHTVTIRLCLDECLEVSNSSPLKCETAKFVLEWDPDQTSLADIKNLLSVAFERLKKRVKVIVVNEGNSIIVTCSFQYNLLGPLIDKAQETLKFVKQSGLIRLTIGYCVIYDKYKRDENIVALAEENAQLRNQPEIQQTISKKKSMEIKSIIKQNEEIILMQESMTDLEDLREILNRKEANEIVLMSISADRLREIQTLQEVVTLLTLQLKKRDKEIKDLKQKFKEVTFILKPLTDQDIEDNNEVDIQDELSVATSSMTQECQKGDDPVAYELAHDNELDCEKSSDKGDVENIEWIDGIQFVRLQSPTTRQCENIMSRLIKEKQPEREWNIDLHTSNTESAFIIIKNLNKCAVRGLRISYTQLDNNCLSAFSDFLTTSTKLKWLQLHCCPLVNIKQLFDGLSDNFSLEMLWLYDVTVTEEDTIHLSHLFSTNKVLKILYLSKCNITDKGIQYICEGLTKNQTLTTLDISNNPHITSASTNSIIKLIQSSISLTELHFDHTSLKDDDIKAIHNMRKLMLSKQRNKESRSYEFIQYRFLKT